MRLPVTFLVLAALLLSALAGCAAGPNQSQDSQNDLGTVAGFWQRMWQGFIAPFVFVASLLKSNLTIYEAHNNGAWYNFAFLLGLACFFGGSGNRTARRK